MYSQLALHLLMGEITGDQNCPTFKEVGKIQIFTVIFGLSIKKCIQN